MCVKDQEKDMMDSTTTNSWPLQHCHLLLKTHMDKKGSFLRTSSDDTTNISVQNSFPVSIVFLSEIFYLNFLPCVLFFFFVMCGSFVETLLVKVNCILDVLKSVFHLSFVFFLPIFFWFFVVALFVKT